MTKIRTKWQEIVTRFGRVNLIFLAVVMAIVIYDGIKINLFGFMFEQPFLTVLGISAFWLGLLSIPRIKQSSWRKPLETVAELSLIVVTIVAIGMLPY